MRKIARLVVYLLALIGLMFVIVTITPVDSWWIARLAGPWYDSKGDVLVVLGSDANIGVIGLSSYWRTVYAIRAWREGGFHGILICGGSGPGQTPVSEQMRDFMVAEGVPASVIRVESTSHNTHENAVNAKPLLEQHGGTKVLLTSDYHMFRAYRVFRKEGIDVRPRPFPDAGKQIGLWWNRWPVFVTLCVETTKIVYYFVRGWI